MRKTLHRAFFAVIVALLTGAGVAAYAGVGIEDLIPQIDRRLKQKGIIDSSGNYSSSTFTGGSLASQITWNSGLGAITHILGPTDQALQITGNVSGAGLAEGVTIKAGTPTATNAAGGGVQIRGTDGTGTGSGGSISLIAANTLSAATSGGDLFCYTGSSPTATNAGKFAVVSGGTGGTEIFEVSRAGSVILHASGSALAQNATDGFTYLPACSTGAPSGTPTSVTGAAPVVIGGDNKLYFYAGGAWTQAGGSGTAGTYTVHSTLTGNTTLDGTATVWKLDTTSAGFTVTLPDAAGCAGRIYVLKKIASANTVTLASTSSQTIDGSAASTFNMTTQWQSYTLISDGANWIIGG